MINKLFKNCVHIGHRNKILNHEMKNYIIKSNKHKMSIINLEKTLIKLREIINLFKNIIIPEKKICLFICNRKKYKKLIELFCNYINMPFITKRWFSGLLTNFKYIYKSISNFNYNYNIIKYKRKFNYKKSETNYIKKKLLLKYKYFVGIRNLKKAPDFIFLINPNKHKSIIKEANKTKTPIISLVDTNVSIKNIDYILPWNDDSIKSVTFLFKVLSDNIFKIK